MTTPGVPTPAVGVFIKVAIGCGVEVGAEIIVITAVALPIAAVDPSGRMKKVAPARTANNPNPITNAAGTTHKEKT
jgi:hypothetical protein